MYSNRLMFHISTYLTFWTETEYITTCGAVTEILLPSVEHLYKYNYILFHLLVPWLKPNVPKMPCSWTKNADRFITEIKVRQKMRVDCLIGLLWLKHVEKLFFLISSCCFFFNSMKIKGTKKKSWSGLFLVPLLLWSYCEAKKLGR